MRKKFCLGFAGLWLAFLPGWVGADVSGYVKFCLIQGQGTARDQLSPNLTCGNAQSVEFLTTRDDSNKTFWTDQGDGVTRAVIVVDAAGVASPAFQSISSGLGTVDSEERNRTWLVALRFTTDAVSGRRLRWSVAGGEKGYLLGNASAAPTNAQLSSFDLVDQFVLKMKAWAPKITELVIVGYGENAEFVNRYSIGTTVDSHADLKGNIASEIPAASVRYLMVSPARYMYLSEHRYSYTSGFDGLVEKLPADKNENLCGGTSATTYYNRYPYGQYGIESMESSETDHYMSATVAALKNRVGGKQRLLLVGSDEKALLNDACAAKEQGASGFERGFNYMHHLRTELTGTSKGNISTASGAGFCVVDRVGSNRANFMLKSFASTLFWKYGLVHCALNDPADCTYGDGNQTFVPPECPLPK